MKRPCARWTLAFGAVAAAATLGSGQSGAGVIDQAAQDERARTCVQIDDQLAARFRLKGPGWIGGDGAQSVAVGDKTLWIFGDSFVGEVEPDGGHNHPGCRLVRNSGLIRTSGGLRMVRPGESLIPTEDEGRRWFWPGDGVYEDGEVRLPVFQVSYDAQRPPWHFRVTGVSVARLSWPGLEQVGMVRKPYDGILWGLSLYQEDQWTYVYGWEEDENNLYVARAPAGALPAAWRYRTARMSWSRAVSKAAPILTDVTTGSVARYHGAFVLVTQRPRLSPEIALYRAPTPYGPFDSGRTLYRTPETGPLAFTYLATIRRRLPGGGLSIGYSVNAWDIARLHADASIYRPRFLRVNLSCLLGDESDGVEGWIPEWLSRDAPATVSARRTFPDP